MPRIKDHAEICPICGTEVMVSDRAWFYTCLGCGSGINLIGIWWREQSGKDWLGLTEKEKKEAGDEFYQRSNIKKWKDVVIEI